MSLRRFCLAAVALFPAVLWAAPVQFDFVAPENPAVANPLFREIWAEVITPSGRAIPLPAYYADGGVFSVRARPEEVGAYRFGRVEETTFGQRTSDIVVSPVSPTQVTVKAPTRLPTILIDPRDPRSFVRSDGPRFEPVGANLAWAPDGQADRLGYYRGAFAAFSKANLNWMRIWMAHWDGLNLDWLPADLGPSPKPGTLDERVAETWDGIVALAEQHGVYIQLVLQHHGQYTTGPNSDWAKNPWNSANPGGFLSRPDDFFTNPNARILTQVKYRYIVARWGWSPAILSWELFNEVHWTDAFAHGHEDLVARWHDDMADYLRSVDVYGHLITTSTDNIRSPVYGKMDYFQPHLYASGAIAAARAFDPAPERLPKPVFYGEEGDDHMPQSDAQKKAGLTWVPPLWASILGEGSHAAQPWDGWDLYAQGRLGEVGALLRFIALSRMNVQRGLEPFSAVVDCSEHVPLVIEGGQAWQRRPAPEVDYPLDGRVPLEAADIPAFLDGDPAKVAQGYPGAAAYRLNLPRKTRVAVRATDIGSHPTGLRVEVDGEAVAEKHWDSGETEILVSLKSGVHQLTVRNLGPGSVGLSQVELGVEVPALAAIGRRNDRFIAAWVWSRPNLYALQPSGPVAGKLELADVPAGSWKVVWWDTTAGQPSSTTVVHHSGGTLKIATPPILRHAAVALSLQD